MNHEIKFTTIKQGKPFDGDTCLIYAQCGHLDTTKYYGYSLAVFNELQMMEDEIEYSTFSELEGDTVWKLDEILFWAKLPSRKEMEATNV